MPKKTRKSIVTNRRYHPYNSKLDEIVPPRIIMTRNQTLFLRRKDLSNVLESKEKITNVINKDFYITNNNMIVTRSMYQNTFPSKGIKLNEYRSKSPVTNSSTKPPKPNSCTVPKSTYPFEFTRMGKRGRHSMPPMPTIANDVPAQKGDPVFKKSAKSPPIHRSRSGTKKKSPGKLSRKRSNRSSKSRSRRSPFFTGTGRKSRSRKKSKYISRYRSSSRKKQCIPEEIVSGIGPSIETRSPVKSEPLESLRNYEPLASCPVIPPSKSESLMQIPSFRPSSMQLDQELVVNDKADDETIESSLDMDVLSKKGSTGDMIAVGTLKKSLRRSVFSRNPLYESIERFFNWV